MTKETLTAAEYREMMANSANPRRSKYRSKKTEIDGIIFDSQKEARRYQELKILRDAGEVLMFLTQVPIIMFGTKRSDGRPERYRVDFMVLWADGRITWEDVKGHITREFWRKKKIIEDLYPIKIEMR